MRKFFFRLGWAVLLLLPVIYGIQIYLAQDLPPVASWQWMIPFAAVVVIFFSRNRDEVLKHHVV